MKFNTLVIFLYTFHYTVEKDEFYLKDIRREFLGRREEKRKQDIRLKILDQTSNNNSLMLEGIVHILDKRTDIEDAFKQILIMKEATYVYKRDFFWRTWREIENGERREIVHYRCSNIIKDNCTRCSGGFWIIDEKPECPYEIFSTHSSNDVCVFKYNTTLSDCSLRVRKKSLMIACKDYIETSMKITKKWNVKGRRDTAILCQGRDFCDLFTLYMIQPDSIIFRIINATHNIILSKIMRNDNKNYICTNNCGKYDPIRKKVVDNDKPLSFNLLDTNKKKREEMRETSKLVPNGLHYVEIGDRIAEDNRHHFYLLLNASKHASTCSKIGKKLLRDENISYFWDN